MKTYEIFTDGYSKIVQAITIGIAVKDFQSTHHSEIKAVALADRPDLLEKIDSPTPKAVTDGEIEEAASAYEKIACCEKDHPFLKEYVNEDFEAGAKWMREQQGEGWISVEDRLPKDGDEVLSWADNEFNICDNNIMLSRYIGPSKGSLLYDTDRDKRWFQYIENDTCFEHHKVTHWMPRPNPPKSYSDKK